MTSNRFIALMPVERSDAVPQSMPRFFAPMGTDAEPLVTPVSFFIPSGSDAEAVNAVLPSPLLIRTHAAFEDAWNPSWRTDSGIPRRWMMRDGHSIRLTPMAAVSVSVGFREAPAELVDDSDTPDPRIPVPHHAYLKFAAAAWLLRQDGDQRDDARAESLMQTFNSLIGASNG